MRRIYLTILILAALLTTSCSSDDPTITFYPQTVTYEIGGGYSLEATFDGVTLTDTDTSVVFSTDADGKIATLTLIAVVPGHGTIVVGGVELSVLPDGRGLEFKGAYAVSETEKVVFHGTIIGMSMTIDVQRVPIG